MKRTAVLIDGGFFIQRVEHFVRKFFGDALILNSEHLSKLVHSATIKHISESTQKTPQRELYRTYFYDCPPFLEQKRYPLPEPGNKTPGTKNFKKHPPYVLRQEFHEKLRSMRKVALRMGELSDGAGWQLNADVLQDLLKGRRRWEDLGNEDFHYQFSQKAVDLKLGMDITTIALGGHADVIVLVAGDSDFVPAAKLARTHGIDFVLDPMWQNCTAGLKEHVDNVRSFDVVAEISKISGVEPTKRPSWWKHEAPNKPPRKSKHSRRKA
ncbi:NYN domain-containing protein [Halomonas elongata]|uniref:NYN domain-containing protein n=1 Tax=Halomonas elongata (strain ATCC 33173 / DSM 2581 / NBRC 15536 / NCIMB 2198 / 1H9) TaxID=768066 RepID=A0ABZ0T7R2_HALED|nr:NYN domain-containing protein [Halomonas elongata]WBF17857.1 NYN domain-containing protein [Halomonas elongata]WPU46702.1 NYN domain-containing protein [Halomonas elongata DSM 2581]